MRTVTLDINALSSLASSLEDITERLGDIGRSAGEHDELGPEALEIERQLQTSLRRLNQLLRRAQTRER